MARLFPLIALTALVLMTGGCRSVHHADYSAFIREPRPLVVGRDYRLGVPDRVVVAIVTDRGVEESAHTLGPAGTLWIAGFGRVTAAGRSCPEIVHELMRNAPDAMHLISLDIRVTSFASQKVFVFGQVSAPGGQAYHGANSVLATLAFADPNFRADTERIQLLRPSPDGEFRRQMTINLDSMIRTGDTTLNVVLREGDVLFVPPTTLGSIGLAWQQVFGATPPPRVRPGLEEALLEDRSSPPVVPGVECIEADVAEPIVVVGEQNLVPEISALEALRWAVAELTDELQRQRELIRASADDGRVVRREPVAWGRVMQGPPRPEPVVYLPDERQPHQPGQDPQPAGVHFWGP